jgi:hypothetical protein
MARYRVQVDLLRQGLTDQGAPAEVRGQSHILLCAVAVLGVGSIVARNVERGVLLVRR